MPWQGLDGDYKMDVSGQGQMQDLMVLDALFESFYGYHMGVTAENVAEKYGITRLEQDELGLLSHQRARAAINEGMFKEEIAPMSIPQKNKEHSFLILMKDRWKRALKKCPNFHQSLKKNGTVTAGNSSGINDAAAAVLLMKEDKCSEYGLKPSGENFRVSPLAPLTLPTWALVQCPQSKKLSKML